MLHRDEHGWEERLARLRKAILMWRVVPVVLALLLAGCGGGSDGSASSGGSAPVVLESLTRPYDPALGATMATSQGDTITVPPAALDRPTTLRVDLLAAPPAEPPNGDFDAEGEYVRLHLGGAQMTGPVEIALDHPEGGAEDFGAVYEAGAWYPEESRRAGRQVLVTVPAPALPELSDGDVEVGVVDSSKYLRRPPHRPWPSYNLYVYDATRDRFETVIAQGIPTGRPFTPGARPALIAHGLGSAIRGSRFLAMARRLARSGEYTAVFGFEYDTLLGISTNGSRLVQALGREPGLTWRHVSHSMGTLVTRSAYEQNGTLPVAPSGNRVVAVAGPHLGSPIIQVIQESSGFRGALAYLLLNGLMEFTNDDGRPCLVTGQEPGFTDLRVGSAFLTALNQNADRNHPQADYMTVAGNSRGWSYSFLNFSIYGFDRSRYMDDGVVNVGSANPPGIGALRQQVVAEDHTSICDSASSIGVIQGLLR